MKVSQIMTKKVVALKPEMPIYEVAKILYKNGVTGAPVINDKKEVLGIVTESDLVFQEAKIHIPKYIQILDSFIYLENPKNVEDELHKILGMTASDVMTQRVFTIAPNASVEEAATMIKEKHINPIPVVKDKKLVGIISRADIVKLLMKK